MKKIYLTFIHMTLLFQTVMLVFLFSGGHLTLPESWVAKETPVASEDNGNMTMLDKATKPKQQALRDYDKSERN